MDVTYFTWQWTAIDILCYSYRMFSYIIYFKNQQNTLIKLGYKTHFILGTNSYMFRQQVAFIREFISSKILCVQQVHLALFTFTPILTVKVWKSQNSRLLINKYKCTQKSVSIYDHISLSIYDHILIRMFVCTAQG